MPGKKGGNKGNQNQSGEEKKFEFNFAAQEGEKGGDRKSVLDLAGKDAHLLNAMQGKLGSLVGKSSGYLETLSKPIQERIKALKKIHSDREKLQEEFEKEMAALQAKYDTKIQPLYNRRSEIVKGESEPSEEELKFVAEGEATPDPNVPPVEDKGEKGIPHFWLTALQHNPMFMDMITERDEEALQYLVDIREVPVEEEPDSFTLEFHFTPNDYFENSILKKTYHVVEDDPEGLNLESSEIQWKTGKNLTVKMVKVQQGGGRGGRGGRGKRGRGGQQGGGKPQTITMEKKCDSFFNFFTNDPLADIDFEGDEEVDPQDIMEMDYETACEIKDEIIPQAVLWFTGEAEIQGAYDDEEGDDEGGMLDEEGDEDEDFEPALGPDGKPVENPQQCQQQ